MSNRVSHVIDTTCGMREVVATRTAAVFCVRLRSNVTRLRSEIVTSRFVCAFTGSRSSALHDIGTSFEGPFNRDAYCLEMCEVASLVSRLAFCLEEDKACR